MPDLKRVWKFERYEPTLGDNRKSDRPFWLKVRSGMTKQALADLLERLGGLTENSTAAEAAAVFVDAEGPILEMGDEPLSVQGVAVPDIQSYIALVTDLATGARQKYATLVQERIGKGLAKYGIAVQDVKIRDIALPQELRAAVDQKIAAQQSAEKQQFVLQQKTQEAEQRRVEAQGLADAQTIIQAKLTDQYLKYEYIQTLQKLVNSSNTTFLFVPNDPNALPNFQLPLGQGTQR